MTKIYSALGKWKKQKIKILRVFITVCHQIHSASNRKKEWINESAKDSRDARLMLRINDTIIAFLL